MAQCMLSSLSSLLPIPLDKIKKEPDFTNLVHCTNCSISVEVFCDSDQNVFPFKCPGCWSMEYNQYEEEGLTEERCAQSTSIHALALIWTKTGLQALPIIFPGLDKSSPV
jgi:hypothetical protein